MNIWSPNPENFDLNCQIEELKGLLRSNDLLLKDQQFKFNKTVENYETQITRLNDENRQLKDKYERIYEAQRKLEKLNSDLEERLLKIVEKYENEQKSLLEDLTIAHSKLVESNLTIEDLEKQKESYRQDCNLAVSLLQCKPNEFVSHSYRSLPVSLKDRLKTQLTQEDILKFENETEPEEKLLNQQQKIPKIPIFQPSAAAALMYTFQNENNKQKKVDNDSSEYTGIYSEDEIDNGHVSSSLLAQVLKKESDEKAKKSVKLFPYVCLRCKKQTILCDSPTQTSDNSTENEGDKVITGKPRNILINEAFLRSKSIGNRMVDLDIVNTNNNQKSRNYHSKSASTDLVNMILESMKITTETSCSDKDFFEKIKLQKTLFEQNLTLYNLSKNQRLTKNESRTYYINLQDILNSINSLVINENFASIFRNNQIINALILDSLNMVFRFKKQRRNLISLVVKILNLTIIDGDFDDVLNAKWFQNLLHGFFLSKKHQLLEFFEENENDYSNKVEIIEFITYMYRIVNVHQIVPCEFLIKSIKYLRSICNDKNVNQFSKAISVVLGKLNLSLVALSQSSNKTKYFEVLSCAKEQVTFLLKNYENNLIENSQSQLVFQLIYRLKMYRSIFPEVDNFGLQLFDLILTLFEDKIDDYNKLKQEYAIKTLEFFDEQIYTYFTTDGQIVKKRFQHIINIMVKIILKSENFDFSIQSDVDFTNFAYEYIYYVFKQKYFESDFMHFFESIWSQIKEAWLKTIKHEKGSMAFRICTIFFKNYESNHSGLIDFFINSMHQFLECQEKNSNKKIDKCFQKSLINLIELADKIENLSLIKDKLSRLIVFYFEIGNELDYVDWLLCFRIFNNSLVDKKLSFIFQNDELSKKFMELITTKIKIESVPNCCLEKFPLAMCKFLYKLVKSFQGRLDLESKYILIEYLEYMSNNVNNSKVKSICQKIIQNVNF